MVASILEIIQDIQKLLEEDRNHLFYLVKNVLQNVKAKQAFTLIATSLIHQSCSNIGIILYCFLRLATQI